MSESHNRPTVFADSNVFIEASLIEESHAAIVVRLVALGWYDLVTCAAVIKDVEDALQNTFSKRGNDAKDILERWNSISKLTELSVHADASVTEIRTVFKSYMHLMRHQNDIPILAAALRIKPDYILSGNREHFNDAVSKLSGIPIFSCPEFIELVASGHHD